MEAPWHHFLMVKHIPSLEQSEFLPVPNFVEETVGGGVHVWVGDL